LVRRRINVNEVKVYNDKGMLVTKPFIFTSTGSMDFYANPNRVDIVETDVYDSRKKSFYFHLTKDEDLNYEMHLRFNPSRIIQTVSNVVAIGTGIKSFFG
jgi:hypothetical protein